MRTRVGQVRLTVFDNIPPGTEGLEEVGGDIGGRWIDTILVNNA